MEIDFNDREIWYGSHYELSMLFEGRALETIAEIAHATLARNPCFEGVWEEKSDISSGETSSYMDNKERLGAYGLIHIGEDVRLGVYVCSTCSEPNAMWLCLCLPVGMLECAYDVDYPLHAVPNPWRVAVDEAFMSIADHVYQSVPFKIALIGEEAAAMFDESELESLSPDGDFGTYLLPRNSELLPSRCRVPMVRRPSGLVHIAGMYTGDDSKQRLNGTPHVSSA